MNVISVGFQMSWSKDHIGHKYVHSCLILVYYVLYIKFMYVQDYKSIE